MDNQVAVDYDPNETENMVKEETWNKFEETETNNCLAEAEDPLAANLGEEMKHEELIVPVAPPAEQDGEDEDNMSEPDTTCPWCDQSFPDSSSMEAHAAKCGTEPADKKCPCDICGVMLSSSATLRRHKFTVHVGTKPFCCNICNASFTENTKLKIHMRRHTGERPYNCDVCSAAFKTRSNLKVHKKRHSDVRPSFECDICRATFTQAANLKVHKRIHSGERPYRCEICERAFIRQAHLEVHKRMHTGERPFPCDLCDAAFTTRAHLITHKRRHTGEKPFPCHVCGASFVIKEVMKNHLRLHTGERPYACSVCDKAFTTSSALLKHNRIHHGLNCTSEGVVTCDA